MPARGGAGLLGWCWVVVVGSNFACALRHTCGESARQPGQHRQNLGAGSPAARFVAAVIKAADRTQPRQLNKDDN